MVEGNSRLLVLTQKACLFSVMCNSSICLLGRMKSLSNSSGGPLRLSPPHRPPPPPPHRSPSLPCCGSDAWRTSGVESLSAPPPRPPPRHIPPPELLPSLRRKPRGSSGTEDERGEGGNRSSSRGLWARLES